VQGVAHAGPTGSLRVDGLLCSETAVPDNDRDQYSEEFARIRGDPFLPNSMQVFFNQNTSRLKALRDDPALRSSERKKQGLPPNDRLIVNISQPNRMSESYLEMVFEVIVRTGAGLVLIEHNESFVIRTKYRFLQAGLSDKLVFVKFRDVMNGDLHEIMALCDVYLDTPGYNSHTAGQDALFAIGIFITVKGNTLAGRLGADLNEHFGTPENTLEDTRAAIDRVTELLNFPEALEQARHKAQKCRTESSMYNNERRAQLVLSALREFYEDRFSQQQLTNTTDNQLKEADMPALQEALALLGIQLMGVADFSDSRVVGVQAEFR
jgi:predicted O-linked N-acetylglucosamine transferase (SPINDLY family)